jgi:serine protease AprX
LKLFLFLIIFLQGINAQQKHLIFFKDKGAGTDQLNKNSLVYSKAVSQLSEKCIARRLKVMGSEIITKEDLPLNPDYLNQLSSSGIIVINELKWFNAVSAELDDSQIALLKGFTFIEKIEPVKVLRFINSPADMKLSKSLLDTALYGDSYTQLRLSDIPPAHKKGITGKGVLLGVLDSGFKWKTHEAIMNADVLAEYDFIFRDSVTENQLNDTPSQHDHGTAVFSVISGYKDSNLIGAAYNAQFLLAKTEDVRSETRIEEDNYAAALEWMENYGVDITTSSLGYSVFDGFSYKYEDMNGRTAIVTKAAELAFERGVLTITSAGNEGNGEWFYITAPADGINTIAVGAVNNLNVVAGFSSRGPSYDGRIKPDIVAMGVSVATASAYLVNNYSRGTGTSLASPIASGAAALLLSAHPHLSNIQMRDIILKTAGNYANPDNVRGYGLISAGKAIEYPNLNRVHFVNRTYSLNKIFLGENVSDVKLYVSTDSRNFNAVDLSADSIRYVYNLPPYMLGQSISFYYTYRNSSNDTLRVPASKNFSFSYGEMLIGETTIPGEYTLANNFPNPFNNSTRINFLVSEPSNASLIIYDALGQKVKTVFNSSVNAGEYSVIWDGRADNGTFCSSGIYIYRLILNNKDYSKKMVLLK